MSGFAAVADGAMAADALALRGLFPSEVATVVATPDMEAAPLLPEEAVFIEGAVPKRRREFALGRASARAALAGFGVHGHALPVGERRSPVWPAGIIGSITHCDGFCAAVAARHGAISGLGVDAEPQLPLPPEILERVCSPDEIGDGTRLPSVPGGAGVWHRLVFSAKESVYKACYPLVGAFLEFSAVRIVIDPAAGRFAVVPLIGSLATALSGREAHGRFALTGGHILTGVTVRRPGAFRSHRTAGVPARGD